MKTELQKEEGAGLPLLRRWGWQLGGAGAGHHRRLKGIPQGIPQEGPLGLGRGVSVHLVRGGGGGNQGAQDQEEGGEKQEVVGGWGCAFADGQ